MRDKKKQREWAKTNVRRIVGVRLTITGSFYDDKLSNVTLTPDMFFFHGSSKQSFQLYNDPRPDRRFHIPRSLMKRARLDININTNEIVGRGNMPYANP